MTCEQIEAEGVIEQYLANRLPNAARKEFELHYFACDHCFETLEAYRATATALKRPARRRLWIWPAAIAAAAAFAVITLRPVPHPTPPIVKPAPLLVQVDPPPYAVPTMRSVPNAATKRFYTAMEPYQRHNYPAAIEALKKFVDGSPKQERPFLDAEFFLGASYLLSNQTDQALATLDPVLTADSPYLEEAHFLAAEAWLKKGDDGHARTELERVIGMSGDLKTRAQALLTSLK